MAEVKAGSLLSRYLLSVEQVTPGLATAPTASFDDRFLRSVCDWLRQFDFQQLYIRYPIAGVETDLVVVRDGHTYCIDLIGYPGKLAAAVPVERWQMLGRIGVRTLALPYSRWLLERERCAEALREFLGVGYTDQL